MHVLFISVYRKSTCLPEYSQLLMQILKNLCNLYFCFTQNGFRKSNSYVEFNVLDVRDRPTRNGFLREAQSIIFFTWQISIFFSKFFFFLNPLYPLLTSNMPVMRIIYDKILYFPSFGRIIILAYKPILVLLMIIFIQIILS